MKITQRIALLVKLGKYLSQKNDAWIQAKERSYIANPWFVPQFVDEAVANIVHYMLDESCLEKWIDQYPMPEEPASPKLIGVAMAGNIPLVGFHDWLCIFASGHRQLIKPSSKDEVLISHLVEVMHQWDPQLVQYMRISDQLRNCDAYIATGSNNTARYFEYYFGRYPHIIRRNRTSVAILTGGETQDDLYNLSGDLLQYFGMGCRNVTKLYIPKDYHFEPLFHALSRYGWMQAHHRYKNNYDYNLSLHILNQKNYLTDGTVLLSENTSLFAPIAQINYEYYEEDPPRLGDPLRHNDIQCICGQGYLPWGMAQKPGLSDYADGVDTMNFLLALS